MSGSSSMRFLDVDSSTQPFSKGLSSQVSKSSPAGHSLSFRVMIGLQTVSYGSYSILVHLCLKNGTILFSSITMNFLIEFFKLLFSLSALIAWPSLTPLCFSWRKSMVYSIPGFLYFFNNNLAVHIQGQMDAASYQMLSNLKILTTAMCYRLIIKQKLSYRRWSALFLLLLASLVYSIGTLRSSPVTASTTDDRVEMYIQPMGIPMMLTYCAVSGLAGVYNEWILKKYYFESLHLQNVYVYTYGTVLNLIGLLRHGSIVKLFDGFSRYTWLIVISQVWNGLSMSVVMKYSSNILRLFIIAFSLLITTLLSLLIFHVQLNIYFLISLCTMMVALAIYYTD